MAGKELIVDLATIDFNRVLADVETIRRYNPQRYEMEHLTAVVYEDSVKHVCVGYKDITPHEFWVRGHMPGMPLMPGVVMCEAAAQISSYFTMKYNLLGDACKVIGFGGMEEVRFRDPVLVGQRLVLMCQLIKCRPGAMSISRFQGIVDGNIVVDGKLKGIPLPVEALLALEAARGQSS